MLKHSKEFKREAVWIALTSGLPCERVASDLWLGKSTLGKWLLQYLLTNLVSAPQAALARENDQLCLENRILKAERDMKKRPRSPSRVCGRLFHSDRGSQYCSYDYQKKLQAYGRGQYSYLDTNWRSRQSNANRSLVGALRAAGGMAQAIRDCHWARVTERRCL
jgi:transposase